MPAAVGQGLCAFLPKGGLPAFLARHPQVFGAIFAHTAGRPALVSLELLPAGGAPAPSGQPRAAAALPSVAFPSQPLPAHGAGHVVSPEGAMHFAALLRFGRRRCMVNGKPSGTAAVGCGPQSCHDLRDCANTARVPARQKRRPGRRQRRAQLVGAPPQAIEHGSGGRARGWRQQPRSTW